MKSLVPFCLVAVLAAAVVSCNQKLTTTARPAALLEGPGKVPSSVPPPEGPVADNSRCHVCHINYEEEDLAVNHAKANIGCEDCHGASDAHCSDEDNITPPDIMYPRDDLNSFCLKCHAADKLSDVHQPILAGTAEEKYCTDCHGQHRLGYRTRHWDKATGELLRDDGVRMIRKEPVREE
jgi:hypothetical protein